MNCCNLCSQFPKWLSSKEFTCQCSRSCRRCGFDPWVRKIPWSRKYQPTPVFSLGNPMDRGAWRITVHGVTKSRTRLSMHAPTHVVSYSNSWTEASFLPLKPCLQTGHFHSLLPHHQPGPCHGVLSALFLTFLPQWTFSSWASTGSLVALVVSSGLVWLSLLFSSLQSCAYSS